MEQRRAGYNDKTNEFYIDANESEFVPAYLKYLKQYLNVPEDSKNIFIRDEINKQVQQDFEKLLNNK